MTFGPDQVLLCTHCRNIFIRNTLGSSNTIGARVWSDGRVFAVMAPTPPVITQCGNCGTWFFLEDARKVGYVPMGVFDSHRSIIPTTDDLEYPDYLQAIQSGLFRVDTAGVFDEGKTRERELVLRERLLWSLNDKVRGREEGLPQGFASVFRENLRRIIELTEPAEDRGALVLRAEALRELGNTDQCVLEIEKLISEIPEDEAEYLDWFIHKAGKIKQAAKSGKTAVFEITKDEQEETRENIQGDDNSDDNGPWTLANI
ncbi:MAG: hypothetical protein ACLFR1_10200 [Spirochaetia bacterium]